MGGYEPNPIPWADRRPPGRFRSSSCSRPTGTISSRSWQQALGARPGARDRRRQAAHQRPRELHARRQLHPRRGPGGARTSSSAPASTPSASPRAAAPAWRSPNGSRTASRPTTSGPSTSAASAATHQDIDWVRTRTLEAYGKHYTMAWPHEEYASGRPLRRSPLYERLQASGAVFGEKLGWERPNWFADPQPARQPEDVYTFGRPNWFERGRRASTAPTRERVALFDQTSFAKFMLTGPRRRGGALLDRRQRRREAAGRADLHADAERTRRHRMRPDRRAPRRGRLLHRHRHRLRDPRLRLDPPQHPRRDSTRGSPTSPTSTRCSR